MDRENYMQSNGQLRLAAEADILNNIKFKVFSIVFDKFITFEVHLADLPPSDHSLYFDANETTFYFIYQKITYLMDCDSRISLCFLRILALVIF